jgi:hypothetical protein
MRIHEVVGSLSTGGVRVVDATQGRLTTALRLPEGSAGSVAEVGEGVVVLAPEAATASALDAALVGVAPGVRVLLFLPCTADAVPVGVVVDSLVRAGLQVTEVAPIEQSAYAVAVVAVRADGLVPVTAYLSGRPAVELDDRSVHRVLAEHLVGGLALRAQVESSIARASAAESALGNRVPELEAEAAASRARLDAVLGSRSYGWGRAFADVRAKPLSGVLHLPGKLRAAGKGPAPKAIEGPGSTG